ncbi:TPA: hypothetical protein N0F65_012802, partial [Lagenidium giganteum]
YQSLLWTGALRCCCLTMGFRGVLLRRDGGAGEGDSTFRVVCPDAELNVPVNETEPDVLNEQVVVVSDFVTSKQVQVARLAQMTLQETEESALWVTTLPESRANAPMAGAEASPGSATLVPPGAATGAAPDAGIKSCFCFNFRSGVEYNFFAHTVTAYQRLQKYTMLEQSVRMEMEIQERLDRVQAAKENDPKNTAVALAKKRPPTPTTAGKQRPRSSATAAPASGVPAERPGSRKAQRRGATLAPVTARKPGAARVVTVDRASDQDPVRRSRGETNGKSEPLIATAAPSPSRRTRPRSKVSKADAKVTHCILCAAKPVEPVSKNMMKHPFVLQDGFGGTVFMCKSCLQRLIAKMSESEGKETCSLCSEVPSDGSKTCAHPQCRKHYCAPCLGRLLRPDKVMKTLHRCEQSSTDEELALCQLHANQQRKRPVKRASTPRATSSPSKDPKKKKVRRESNHDSPDRSAKGHAAKPTRAQSAGAADVPVMDPLDYLANYFEFLTTREAMYPPPAESEDVCFCCKDGGDVIECDWKHYSGGKNRQCPKVYHGGMYLYESCLTNLVPDCLGYTVSDDIPKWECPRHRCHACGKLAKFSCRFCVTSYCEGHLPPTIKSLGPASIDIATSIYMLCPVCEEQAMTAVEMKKLDPEIYNRIFIVPKKRNSK